MFISWLYSSKFPTFIFWWINTISCTFILSAGSEYLCMNRELEPIILGSSSKSKSKTSSNDEDVELMRLQDADH